MPKSSKDTGQEPDNNTVLRENTSKGNAPKSTASPPTASQSAPTKKTAAAKENAAAMLDLAAALAQGSAETPRAEKNTGKIPKSKHKGPKITSTRQSPLDNLCDDDFDAADAFDTWGVQPTGPGPMLLPYPVYAARRVMGPPGLQDVYPADDDWGYDPDEYDYDDDDETAEDHDDGSTDDVPEAVEPAPEIDMTADDGDDDLMSAYWERFADEEGPPMGEQLVKVANDIWMRGRDPNAVKDIMTKHPRPANLKCQKVDINPEVLSSIPKPARTRDAKLRAVQNGVARAVVPIVKIAEAVSDHTKPLNRKELINLTLDSITLLANANSSVNQTRRDALKPNIQNRFQVLCRVPREDDSTSLLLGAGLTDRIKAATQGGKLGRRGYGFAAQAPSAYGYTRGRRSYGFHPYGSQTYFRGYGRGQHFLRKSSQKISNKTALMIKCSWPHCQITHLVFHVRFLTLKPLWCLFAGQRHRGQSHAGQRLARGGWGRGANN